MISLHGIPSFCTVSKNVSIAAQCLRFIRRKPWKNVKNGSDLNQNGRNVEDPSECDQPGGNIMACVVDRGVVHL